MEAKQKVTLYLPNQVHSQLKIRAAIDQRSMSELTEQAVTFYLTHPDVVQAKGIGHIHQVYNCPACSETLVIKKGDLYAVSGEKSSLNNPKPDGLGANNLLINDQGKQNCELANQATALENAIIPETSEIK